MSRCWFIPIILLLMAGCSDPKPKTQTEPESNVPREIVQPARIFPRAQLEANRERLKAQLIERYALPKGQLPEIKQSDGTQVVTFDHRFDSVTLADTDESGRVHISCTHDIHSVVPND